jgi:hypothetical protein
LRRKNLTSLALADFADLITFLVLSALEELTALLAVFFFSGSVLTCDFAEFN